MKYLHLVGAALLGLAVAQTRLVAPSCLTSATLIPECGFNCIMTAAGDFSCDQLDLGCQCSAFTSLESRVQPCVLSACGDVQTALEVKSAAEAVCSCVSSAGGGGATPSPAQASATNGADGQPLQSGTSSAEAAPAAVVGSVGSGIVGALLAAIAAL